jgi:hypothetical protein
MRIKLDFLDFTGKIIIGIENVIKPEKEHQPALSLPQKP